MNASQPVSKDQDYLREECDAPMPGLKDLEPNTERIKMWVKGLLSGEWEQGHNALVDVQLGYCCLAVATAVAIENGCEHVQIIDDSVTVNRRYVDEAEEWIDLEAYGPWHSEDLPRVVAQWYGLPNTNPMLDGSRAIHRNDEMEDNFEQIAEAIIKQYLIPKESTS